jgi:hypothetical protein
MKYGETIKVSSQERNFGGNSTEHDDINDYELLFADTKIINQYIQNVYLFFQVHIDNFTPQQSFEHSQYKWIPLKCYI